MEGIVTIEELLPLLVGITNARDLAAVVVRHVRNRHGRRAALALEARDRLGLPIKDTTVKWWLNPRYHLEDEQMDLPTADVDTVAALCQGAPDAVEVGRRMCGAGLYGRQYLPLAREACQRLGLEASDNHLLKVLGPDFHSPERLERWVANAKQWRELPGNRERERQKYKEWLSENPEYWNLYNQARWANDPVFKLAKATRNRIGSALYKSIHLPAKAGPSLELLGCTATEYRSYLEALFEPGMDWSNWGQDWEIDHVRPVASFDLRDPEQQRAAFHYSNTRPMRSTVNRCKGAVHGGRRWKHSDHG
jgi:hypothetical protein